MAHCFLNVIRRKRADDALTNCGMPVGQTRTEDGVLQNGNGALNVLG